MRACWVFTHYGYDSHFFIRFRSAVVHALAGQAKLALPRFHRVCNRGYLYVCVFVFFLKQEFVLRQVLARPLLTATQVLAAEQLGLMHVFLHENDKVTFPFFLTGVTPAYLPRTVSR